MQEKRFFKRPWLILAAGVLVTGLVLGSLGMVQRWGSKDQPLASGALLEDAMVPPIDTDQSAGFETATFALG